MAGNTEYPTLVMTSTLRKYRKTFADNVFDTYPLLDWLKRKDNVRMLDGGESIVEQLMYGKNSTFQTYSGYETLNITAQEGFSAAVFPWKQASVSVALSGLERRQNAGDSKLFDILKAKIKQAELSMSDGLNAMLFADGTGNSGKDLLGLTAIVGNNTVGPTTVGGIDCTAVGNDFWRSVVINAAADGSAVRDDDEWTNAFNSASRGGDRPDFAITTQALFEHYEASLVPQLRYTSNESADGRFQNLDFKGLRLNWDLDCNSGVTWFLNSRHLHLAGHKDAWMSNTDFKEAPDKDAVWSQILLQGNLTTSNRARMAKVYGQAIA